MKRFNSFSEYFREFRDAQSAMDSMLVSDKDSKKYLGTFRVSLLNTSHLLENIEEINKIQEKFSSMEILDNLAAKNNSIASKCSRKKHEINSKLNEEKKRLIEEYFKQIMICKKQYDKLKNSIKDKNDHARLNECAKRFLYIWLDVKDNKLSIPFSNQNYKNANEHAKHERESEAISDSSRISPSDLASFDEALRGIMATLTTTQKDKLNREVSKEVFDIKSVLTPKKITVSKENAEKLRYSALLNHDLEQVSGVLSSVNVFVNPIKDKKLSKIIEDIEYLKELVEEAKKKEQERKGELELEKTDVESQLKFATSALNAYREVLNGNQRLEEDKEAIEEHSHGYQIANESLKQKEEVAAEQLHEILAKSEEELTDQDLSEKIRLEAKKHDIREEIHDNEKRIQQIIETPEVTSLPTQYTNMKKKLKEVSAMHEIPHEKTVEISAEEYSL